MIADLTAAGRQAQRARASTTRSRRRGRSSSRASASCRSARPSSRRKRALLTGVRLSGEARYSVYERLWTRPSLTVIAMESHPLKGSSNQIVNAARARLSLRTVPNMDGPDAGRLLVKRLTKNPPYGAKVTAKVTGSTPWWTTDPEGPAFEAARRALKAGYGKETAMIGAGGSIGFVGPFEKTARRRALPAHGRRGSLLQRPLGEREPRPRGLQEVDPLRHLPVRRTEPRQAEVGSVSTPVSRRGEPRGPAVRA